MTGHDDFDRTLARWFEAEAASPAPADSLQRVIAATRRRRPRAGWLARPGSDWVGEDSLRSSSGVGAIPRLGLRWSTALVLLLILAAVLGAAVMVGARLLLPAPPATGQPGHLAYGRDGDVFLAEWDGRNPVRIADGIAPGGPTICGSYWGEGPMWSPDGRHLAYRSAQEGCPGTIYVSDADGHVVASVPGNGWLVSWSPDSTRVATWVDDSESRTIGIYGLDGVRQALLTLPTGLGPPGDYDPLWSPDGRSILMRLAPPSPSEVWELPVDSGAPRHIPPEDPRSHWNVQYSPDGAQVAFIDGNSLVVAAADGSGSRVLASGLELWANHTPLWSPTGDRIAFSWTDDPHDELSGPYTHELRVLDVTSGTVTTLASDRGTDPLDGIAFSPEGDRILFSRQDVEGLWIVNADGSDARLLVARTSWGDWQRQPAGP